MTDDASVKARAPLFKIIAPPPHCNLYTPSFPPIALAPHQTHNAPHILYQERARRRRTPLLLLRCPPHGRGRDWLWLIEAYWFRWRVSLPERKLKARIGTVLTYWGSDAFTKRESASEELYIRQEERAKYVYNSNLQWHHRHHSAQATPEHKPERHPSTVLTHHVDSRQSRRSSSSRSSTLRTWTSTCQ
jgi:hypothetical protein